MSRTPARKRGEDGRLLPLEEAQPDQGPGPDNFGEGVWEAGEDFGSVGPAAFGTPEQQASIADLQAFQTEVQAEQAKAREAAEASRSDVAPQSVIDLRSSRARSLLGGAMTFV